MGPGYADTPGIWSDEQVEGWKQVTEAVRRAGGRIFLQLWHVGRISDPLFLNGDQPLAPSRIKPAGHVSLVRPIKEYVTPRALDLEEIPGIVAADRKGVEIHGANGYLLDQFLQDKTNRRTDACGGPIENRARLMLEVTDACIDVWGAGRVGMHLAPRRDAHDMGDSTPLETFGYVARELGKRGIAFNRKAIRTIRRCGRTAEHRPPFGICMHIPKGIYFPLQALPAAKNLRSSPHISTINIADMLFLRDPFPRQSSQGQP